MNNPTTDTNDDLQYVDNSKWSQQKDALDALKNKSYYKTLIEEGYFKEYTLELVKSLADPYVVENGLRGNVLEKLVGIAKLDEYFTAVGILSTTEDTYREEIADMERKETDRLAKLNTALEQANNDKDFVKLFMESYLRDYAADQTSLLTNDIVVGDNKRKDVLEALSGISTLHNYLVDIRKEYTAQLADMEELDDEEDV